MKCEEEEKLKSIVSARCDKVEEFEGCGGR